MTQCIWNESQKTKLLKAERLNDGRKGKVRKREKGQKKKKE